MIHKPFYIGRTENGDYEIGTTKNYWSNYHGWIDMKILLGDFCGKTFEAVTGFALPIPCKPVKVLISVEKIEKKK